LRHQLLELGYLVSAHAMSAESVAFNVQPRSNGQLLIGSSRELVGWDAGVNPAVLQHMLARAAWFLPAIDGVAALRVWTGFRPATADKLPLIGPLEKGPWVAAGHEGLGITTALATGELVADLLAGRTPALDPAPFAPTRCAAEARDSQPGDVVARTPATFGVAPASTGAARQQSAGGRPA
jgi:glycine/D-amino acid oxidase-like deaminating enzyme